MRMDARFSRRRNIALTRIACFPLAPLVLWHFTDMSDPRWIWGKKYVQLRQNPSATTKQKIGLGNTKGWAAYALNGELFIKRYGFDRNAIYADFGLQHGDLHGF